jgi:hypothetical protein
MQAFKTSVEILQKGSHPLVIFPEGDIYHHNDRVSPFRDGAAAIALSAAKRSDRPILSVPCAVKAFYLNDPSPELVRLMSRLEESLHWKPASHLGMAERIYRFAEGLLVLKELEYLRQAQSGPLRERVRTLSHEVLSKLEQKHSVKQNGSERIAETMDKFEEDVLHANYPTVRGDRKVVVQFGEPVKIPDGSQGKPSVAEWTDRFELQVQSLLDAINAQPPTRAIGSVAT